MGRLLVFSQDFEGLMVWFLDLVSLDSDISISLIVSDFH